MSERAQLPETSLASTPTDALLSPELVHVDQADVAELFAAHIARVEEESPLDTVAGHSRASHLVALGAGGCVGEAVTTLYDYSQFSLPQMVAGGIWLGGSALAIGGAQLGRRRLARRRFDRNNGEALLTQIGHIYEAYRVPEQRDKPKSPQETVLHWHGAAVPKGTPESTYPTFLNSIRSISRLAEQNAVSRIVVDAAVLKKGMPELVDEEASAKLDNYPKQSLKELLEAARFDVDEGVRKKLDTLHDLRSFTPRELRSFVEEQLGTGGIDSLIGQLDEAVINDPMAALHDRLKQHGADQETIRTSIRFAAEQALARNLEAAPRVLGQASAQNPTKAAARGEVTCRIIDDQVEVRRTSRTSEGIQTNVTMHPLNELLPTTDIQCAQFDDDPTLLNPQQRKLIIYERLYNTARDILQLHDQCGADDNRPSQPVIADSTNLIQPALVNSLLSPALRKKEVRSVTAEMRKVRLLTRAGVMAAVAAASGIGVGFAHEGILQSAQADFNQRYAAAVKTGKEPDMQALRDAAWQKDARTRTYEPLVNLESELSIRLQDFLGDSVPQSWQNSGLFEPSPAFNDPYQGQGGSSVEGFSSVGNVNPKSENKVEWYLDPHNMNTTGYWGAATYRSFGTDAWETGDSEVDRWKVSLPTAIDPKDQSYIGVRRHLDKDQVPKDIALPILEGTQLVAANIDGHPVALQAGADGSYVLRATRSGELTYFVDNDVQQSAGLRATDSADFFYYSDEALRASDIWKQEMPNRSQDPSIRVQQEMAYIRDTFTYALDPLSRNNPASRDLEGINFLTAEALDRKKAVCNLAATILIADNTSLNYVDGWRNTNDRSGKQQILSSHEAHAWAVDSVAGIYDATPAGSSSELDAFFDESKVLPKDKENTATQDQLGIAGGGIFVAGIVAHLAYRRRRSIVKTAQSTRAKIIDATVLSAAIVADAPGKSRSYALGARDSQYALQPDHAATYLEASQRRATDRSRLADVHVADEPELDDRLKHIGLSLGLRLAIRTRLALRRYVQRFDQRETERAFTERQRKAQRVTRVAMQTNSKEKDPSIR